MRATSFAHRERLCHVVVGAGVEPADLSASWPRAVKHDDGDELVDDADRLAHT